MTLPCPLVFRSEDVIPEIARDVVVALVVVERERLGRNWRVPRVVVALMRASAKGLVKYRLVDPTGRLSVVLCVRK